MNKIIFIFCIFFIIFPFSIVQASTSQTYTIAFIPKSLDNPIFLDTFEAAQEEAKNLGVHLEWIAPFGTTTEGQVKVIQNLIREKVDGIIISANNSDSLTRVINKSVDAGIPVVTFDSDCPESKRIFYIGTNNYQAGEEMGKALLKVLAKKNFHQDKYNIMILTGDKGALNLNKRVIGFKKVVGEKLNLGKIDIVYCHDNIQQAIALVEEYISKHSDLDIIFFAGGWPFYAPADAMPNFQKWAAEDSTVAVGIDIFYSALVLEKEGLIDYLIGQDFAGMGRISLQYLIKYLETGELSGTLLNTGLNHANEDNLRHLLKIYKPWEVR